MDKARPERIRFGEFELDVRAGELRKGKFLVRLQEQPLQVLLVLLENPGKVVTREEIRERLWPDDTIVEFDHGIGTAVKKLRQALNDGAESPRYVETLPRRGFRFIYPEVVRLPEAGASDGAKPGAKPAAKPDALITVAGVRAGGDARTTAGQETGIPSARRRRLLPALLVSALVLLVAAVFIARLWWRRGRGETLDESSLTQVTTSTGVDIYPSLSPDGSAVAYSSDKVGGFEIYVKTLAPGGREIQLTNDGNENLQPAWSPDGTQIAYFSGRKDGIWLIPALGGTPRRLTEFGAKPAWSPDGSHIAFQSVGELDYNPTGMAITLPSSTLWMVEARGGTPTQLTHPGNPSGGHGAPAWSSDGKRIAFNSSTTSLQEIWTIPAFGGTPQRLVSGGVYDPVYGPGGRHLYFSKSFVGSRQQTPVALTFALMRVPLSLEGAVAGEPEIVKDSGSEVYRAPRFSANGRFLVFSAATANDNLQSIRISPSTGEAVGDPVSFTHDTTLRKLSPLFSPDGKQVAYVDIQNGEDTGIAVWVADANGENAHPVGATATDRHLIGWLPGHGGLAFEGEKNGHKVLDAIDLNTGTISVLRDLPDNGSSFRLSPDGKQVAFGKRENGAVNVWVAPSGFGQAGSGPARQLTFGKGLMSYPCWSPDGKTIAIETENGIAAVPAAGGPVTVLQVSPRGPSEIWDWAPDGDKLVFAGYRNGAMNLFWVSRSTRQEKQLTHYTRDNSYVRYPAWSPRGDQIVYEYSEITANIWTMRLK